ncbi:MAG: DUF6524 family protein [Pseudoprimorskyibacter sp.]|nr:DUF6524 family protein [Pseudoprimorskyibacter sp.]
MAWRFLAAMTVFMAFLSRWIQAFVALAAWINPWGWDYQAWAWSARTVQPELVIGVGIGLAVFFLWQVIGAIRGFGVRISFVTVLVLGTMFAVVHFYGLLGLDNPKHEQILWLISASAVIAFGRWSGYRRKRRLALMRARAEIEAEARLRHPDLEWSKPL